jgi:hypothetical protein
MKYLFFLLSALLTLSCESPESEPEKTASTNAEQYIEVDIEAIILDSLESSFTVNGNKILASLDNLEKNLIGQGMLESQASESYYNLLKMITKFNYSEVDSTLFEAQIFRALYRSSSDMGIDPIEKAHPKEFKTSKFHRISQKIKNLNSPTISTVLQVYSSEITTEDCKKKLYKTLILLAFLDTVKTDISDKTEG